MPHGEASTSGVDVCAPAVPPPEGMEEVKVMTAKEVKKLAKPEFAANPEKFYPVNVLKRWGFERALCPKTGAHFWRHHPKHETCGDASATGRYTFIGTQQGVGRDHHVTYAEAYALFREAMAKAVTLDGKSVPHTDIKRYPVVARWRQDVDFVAAGIFCFQPHCVTGELEPPANPLTCPQFCLRFNDLDNIGLTGRHYSGFVMQGIQVFNTPDNFVYFKEECVDFNLNYLVNYLKIDLDEITLIEDVWAGGGNLGPCIEYFVGGLEIGNMVFMQYKTFPDGSRQELQVKVIDVGIGLERVPWVLNGSPTSYVDVFPLSIAYLSEKTGVSYRTEMWEKFGPLSCRLDVDETADINATWREIAAEIGVDVKKLRDELMLVRDLYIIADHTRTVLVAVEDGALPSNVGGGSNLRNVLRRVFSLMKRHGWWETVGMDGLLHVFDLHRRELAELWGPAPEYKSFDSIIRVEYDRWLNTDADSRRKLDALVKKRKGTLNLEDWVMAIESFGIDADRVSELTGIEKPDDLFNRLAELQERTARAAARQLYDTVHLPPTDELFYDRPAVYEFDAKVVAVYANVTAGNRRNIVILDRSAFYPLGGGQEWDTGAMTIDGVQYKVERVEKVGRCALHYLDADVPDGVGAGSAAHGVVNQARRVALRNHHTATHLMSAACRKVLGPHVWQNGAKKSEDGAHLDITHFRGVTRDEEIEIENEVNRMIREMVDVHKFELPKEKAEQQYGFSLYQGGVVPGRTLRIVDVVGHDTEACCGTHCDNTAEIGAVRILRSNRISDGVVRLFYVASEGALKRTNEESQLLYQLQKLWGVSMDGVLKTAERFFTGYKSHLKEEQQVAVLESKVAVLELLQGSKRVDVVFTDNETPMNIAASVPKYAQQLRDTGKGIVFVGKGFVYGLLGQAALVDVPAVKKLAEANKSKFVSADSVEIKEGKKSTKVTGVVQFQLFGNVPADVSSFFKALVAQ